MITVKPIEEKAEQARLCALCSVPYQSDLLAYRAEDDGVFAGVCQFKLDGEGGHLYHLAAPEGGPENGQEGGPEGGPRDDALFVMGRAALNFMDLCGASTAFFDGVPLPPDALLRRIGFSRDSSGRYALSLEGFFRHPCRHASS